MRTGTANLPLHYGTAPAWLFARMTKLAREIISLLVIEFGPREVLARLSDPYWFQALGCVLGFDWHSSGVTTTVCGAIKEGLRGMEGELGLFVAGGKGKASRKTPEEIRKHADEHWLDIDAGNLVYASRMSAKVDSAALQDGFQIYHHSFFFSSDGTWAVVQQGMNADSRRARRYHWLSSGLESFVREPHAAVCSEGRAQKVLNMVASEAEASREASAQLAGEKPEKLLREMGRMRELTLAGHHEVLFADIEPRHLSKILLKTYERKPEDFQRLLEIEGVGPKTIRALAMTAELVYGVPACMRDPARFSFAHGGKDGHPYPVDRVQYDRTISIIRKAVERARMGESETRAALQRLARFYELD